MVYEEKDKQFLLDKNTKDLIEMEKHKIKGDNCYIKSCTNIDNNKKHLDLKLDIMSPNENIKFLDKLSNINNYQI